MHSPRAPHRYSSTRDAALPPCAIGLGHQQRDTPPAASTRPGALAEPTTRVLAAVAQDGAVDRDGAGGPGRARGPLAQHAPCAQEGDGRTVAHAESEDCSIDRAAAAQVRPAWACCQFCSSILPASPDPRDPVGPAPAGVVNRTPHSCARPVPPCARSIDERLRHDHRMVTLIEGAPLLAPAAVFRVTRCTGSRTAWHEQRRNR